MLKFPKNLTWKEIVRLLQDLGYRPYKSKRGSTRTFRNPDRQPEEVSFNEPRKKQKINSASLREYIKKLQISREEFLDLLNKQ